MRRILSFLILLLAGSALAQVNVIDSFNGTGTVNPAYWNYNWPTDTYPPLDGSGNVVLPAPPSPGPFQSGISGHQTTSNTVALAGFEGYTTTVELQVTCPSSSVSLWFGRSDFGSWGSETRVVKWGPAANGNLEIDSWQGSNPEDTGIAYPVNTPFRLRMVTDYPTGGPVIQRFFYNFGSSWVEYIPTKTIYKGFTPGNYTWLIMNQSGADSVTIGEYILSQVTYSGPVLTPTPTPEPTPVITVPDAVVEDLFEMTSGTAPRSDLWTRAGSSTHDGNGFLSMPEGSGPFAQIIHGSASTLNKLSAIQVTSHTYTLELFAKMPAGSRLWFGHTDYGSWGNPSKVVKWGTESNGNLVLDSWQGSHLEDTGIPYPVNTVFGLKIVLIGNTTTGTGGAAHYYYDFGSGWQEYLPLNTAFRSFSEVSIIPLIMNESPASTGPILLDTYRLRLAQPPAHVNRAKAWELY
jgi:hypothetical protein